MKKLITILALSLASLAVHAAGGSAYPLDKANVDLSDRASLQRGAKYFVNYCMGCHAMGYLRYNRLGRDLGLTDREVEENLIFTQDDEGSPTKVGELMTIAMDQFYAEKSFGVVPPDLTLVTRTKPHGADWLYTYLRTFFADESKQWGVDNALFPNVGMPNVLWELQGVQKPIYKEKTDDHGHTQKVITGFEIVEPGTLTPAEFDQVALDLTNFLFYAAEPARLVRHTVGAYVLVFLVFLTIAAYLLKKEYWRDIKK